MGSDIASQLICIYTSLKMIIFQKLIVLNSLNSLELFRFFVVKGIVFFDLGLIFN
jgi:hypothetical protein